jgi:hypothetical protein
LGKQLRKQNDSDQMHGSTIASFQKLAVADAKRPTHALWGSLKQATDPSPNCRGTDAMIREKQNLSYCSKKIDRLLPLPVPPSPEVAETTSTEGLRVRTVPFTNQTTVRSGETMKQNTTVRCLFWV